MIELWIPATIGAAFMQNLRSALQKHLTARLSTAGASYVRFFYAWPFALLYVWALAEAGGYALPRPNAAFLVYVVLGAVAQILFTFLLIHLFSFRNFAVGTTYSKTEVVQVAILGFVLLGDTLSPAALVAIALSAVGVVALSVARAPITAAGLVTSLFERPALIGLASGTFLGASVVFFRAAALALGSNDFIMAAGFTFAVAVVIQTVIMGAYLRLREPGQIAAALRNWRTAGLVGLAGALASVGWFTAFTLQNAAYVRALGQIELVFTFVASLVVFRERTNAAEFAGILLLIAGILILILAG